MKQFIINADDFGISEIVTSEIERMIEKGCVSSTTVMANGKCLDEVKRFASLHPEVSFGVHFCLSEYESLTKSEGLFRAGLTDERGFFIRKAIFKMENLDIAEVQRAIKEELNAQVEVIKNLDIPISHADSHHHVHTIYSLRKVFFEVLKEQAIGKIRIGASIPLHSRIHLYHWLTRERVNSFYKKNFATADSFYSYANYVKRRPIHKRDCIVELMCHPGHPAGHFQEEMKLVADNEIKNFNEVVIINYNDL